MKTFKRSIAIIFVVIMALSVIAVGVQAASLSTTTSDYGYMLPTDSKFTKAVSSVKLYGSHDYINFYIDAEYDNTYFFYEIYSDKNYTKLVTADYVYCEDRGTYTWAPMITLKGVFSSKTYYCITYGAKMDSSGNVKLSTPSVTEFKLVVDRTTAFNKQVVLLKNTKNTLNGPQITWYKHSSAATKYVVYRRSVNGTKWTTVGTVNGSVLTFTDKSVKDKSGTYVYTVKALNKSGAASRYQFSGITSAFVATPQIKSVETQADNKIKVEWTSIQGKTYRVYRKTNGGSWETIAKEYYGVSYTDKNVENGNTYEYTVKALGNNATSDFYTGNKVDYVAAPELLPVKAVDGGLEISWNEAKAAIAYTVYRRPLDKSSGWASVGKVDADTLSFVDESADKNSSYIYTVRSEGATSRGSYNSKGVEYIVLEKPKVTAKVTESGFEINWNEVPNAQKYELYMRDVGGEWVKWADAYLDSYDIRWGSCNEKEFTVRAVRNGIFSEFADATEPVFYFPQLTTYCTVYTDYNKVYWTDIGADSYNLYKKPKDADASQYELIYSGKDDYFNDSEVEYYEGYTYLVKAVYKSKEQSEKLKAQDMTRYKAEDYIEGFDAGQIVYRDKFEYVWIEANFKEAARGLKYGYSYKLSDDESADILKVGCGDIDELREVYKYTGTSYGHKIVGVYSLQVRGSDYSTPVDVWVDVVKPEMCAKADFKLKPVADGLNVSWAPVENAVSYMIIVENPKRTEVVGPIEADGSNTCSTVISKDIANTLNSISSEIMVAAKTADGNITVGSIDRYNYFSENPKLLYVYKTNDGNRVVWEANDNYNVFSDHSYIIFRKAPGDKSWTKIRKYYGDRWGSQYYTDKTAQAGVDYIYTVMIYDDVHGCYASYYDTQGLGVNKLGAPELISAVNHEDGVMVTWKKNTEASSYYVYRKTTGSSWEKLGNTKEASFVDTTAKSGIDYSYTVIAVKGSHKSAYDKTGVSVHYLAAPRVQDHEVGDNYLEISWNKVNGADGYYLYRKQANTSSWVKIADVTENFYKDIDVKTGAGYYYAARAYSDKGLSAYVEGDVIANLDTPILKSVQNTTKGIKVTWESVDGAYRYNVFRKAPGGSWKVVKGSCEELYFVDENAKDGVEYSYTVVAFKPWNLTYYAGGVAFIYVNSERDEDGLTIKRLATPSLTSATRSSSGVTVKWSKVTGANGYYVYRKTANSGWSRVGTIKNGSTVAFTDKTAKAGTTYYYTVKAYSGANTSAYNTTGIKCK